MKQGRPLRFLGVTLAGWTALRVVMLWPAEPALTAIVPAARQAPAQARPARGLPVAKAAMVSPPVRAAEQPIPTPVRAASPMAPTRLAKADVVAIPPTLLLPLPAAPASSAGASPSAVHFLPVFTPPRPIVTDPPRLAGSSWLVLRQGRGESLAFGQLGASQGGIRLTYAVEGGVALSGRLSAPLHGGGREAALGVDWKPTRLPVHVLAEQRIDTDTGRTRSAVEVIAGAAAALPLGLAIDGYAQGGAVAGRGGFIDGAARLSRTVAELGSARIDLGGGAWGGVQRGASRLDVGPVIGVSFPGSRGSARLSLDYRLRVAGRAAPGSGPALTLGTSF